MSTIPANNPRAVVMATPDSYLCKNLCGIITDYTSYRNARRMRKWIKEYPHLNYRFSAKHNQQNVTIYAIPPHMIWDKNYEVPHPDVHNMILSATHHDRSHTRPDHINAEYDICNKRLIVRKDSENLIGYPL